MTMYVQVLLIWMCTPRYIVPITPHAAQVPFSRSWQWKLGVDDSANWMLSAPNEAISSIWAEELNGGCDANTNCDWIIAECSVASSIVLPSATRTAIRVGAMLYIIRKRLTFWSTAGKCSGTRTLTTMIIDNAFSFAIISPSRPGSIANINNMISNIG